jgi:hypothetical protein
MLDLSRNNPNLFFYPDLISYLCINQLNKRNMSSLKKITHEQLKDRLRQGVVKFYFHKVGGELRIAMGTRDLSRIPVSGHPKGGSAPSSVTTFFDLEKSAWRSISVTKEVWVD